MRLGAGEVKAGTARRVRPGADVRIDVEKRSSSILRRHFREVQAIRDHRRKAAGPGIERTRAGLE